MKKAVGWIRKGKKADEARQRKAIEEYCVKENMQIVDWLSGENFGDVAFGNWMGHRRIDAVVAASCADVTGRVFDFHAYRCKLRTRNSNLVVANYEGFPGYNLYQRKLFDEFVSTYSKLELSYEPLRNLNGRVRKAANGEYIGGNAPMGYRVEDRKLIVNPEEVPVVLFIMEEKHRGGTKLGTVEKLNAQGFKTRNGGQFKISTVQSIWNNEKLYRGYRKSGDEWVKGQHEAILKD